MTENEQRLFNIVLRLVSTLEILRTDMDAGFADVSLPANLRVIRQYLSAECPTLLAMIELIYGNVPIPQGMSERAEQEALIGYTK